MHIHARRLMQATAWKNAEI